MPPGDTGVHGGISVPCHKTLTRSTLPSKKETDLNSKSHDGDMAVLLGGQSIF